MGSCCPVHTVSAHWWPFTHHKYARGFERYFLSGAGRYPMAHVAERLAACFDRATIGKALLRLKNF